GALLALWHGGPLAVALGYVVIGTGFGCAMAALPRLVHLGAPAEHSASANGVNTVARTVGGAVGSQAGVAVLAAHPAGAGLPAAGGFTAAFWLASALAAVAAALVLVLPGRRPAR
ncbi:MFS transporter, partial [Streptomyces sp. SID11385]|nr:MFS transporter [Streptomyces sp. SID11385]